MCDIAVGFYDNKHKAATLKQKQPFPFGSVK